jgi:hypothetical protein
MSSQVRPPQFINIVSMKFNSTVLNAGLGTGQVGYAASFFFVGDHGTACAASSCTSKAQEILVRRSA